MYNIISHIISNYAVLRLNICNFYPVKLSPRWWQKGRSRSRN